MEVAGIGAVVLVLNAEAEPQVCSLIAALAKAGAYADATLTRKSAWVALAFADQTVKRAKAEPRRVVHSKFERGSVGWSWSKVPSDGTGEIFFTVDRVQGLDAAYQEIGYVVGAGVALLGALPIMPTSLRRGEKVPAPAIVESMRVVSGRPHA